MTVPTWKMTVSIWDVLSLCPQDSMHACTKVPTPDELVDAMEGRCRRHHMMRLCLLGMAVQVECIKTCDDSAQGLSA